MYPTPVAPVPAARVHPGAEKRGCDVRNVRITQTMRCQSSSQTFCSLPVKHCAVQLQSNKCFPWYETSGVHGKPSKRPSLCVKIKEMKNSVSLSFCVSLCLSLCLTVAIAVWFYICCCCCYYYYFINCYLYFYWCCICLYPSVIIFHCECLGYL